MKSKARKSNRAGDVTEQGTTNDDVEMDPYSDELIIGFAAGLLDPNFDHSAEAEGASSCQALSNFVKTSRQFRRCAEELLYRHIDLSARPLEQPFQLLDTLLETPELGKHVRSLKIWVPFRQFDGLFEVSRAGPHDRQLDLALQKSRLPGVLELIDGAQFPDNCLWKARWKARWKKDLKFWTCYWDCALLLLMPRLEHLEILNAPLFYHIAPFLSGPKQPLSGIILSKLSSLRISTSDCHGEVVCWIPHFACVSQLKALEVTYQADDAQTPSDFTLRDYGLGVSRLETLTLNGWMHARSLQWILAHFTTLRSLTYRPAPSVDHPWDSSPAEASEWGFVHMSQLWNSLLPVKDTLEELILELPGSADQYFGVWPQNLQMFESMKSLKISGGFILLPPPTQELHVDSLFPPNLEKWMLEIESRALEQASKNPNDRAMFRTALQGIKEYLRSPRINLTNLNTITLSEGIFSSKDIEQVKASLSKRGITLWLQNVEPNKNAQKVERYLLDLKKSRMEQIQWFKSEQCKERAEKWTRHPSYNDFDWDDNDSYYTGLDIKSLIDPDWNDY